MDLTIDPDEPISALSTVNGDEIDAIAFNMSYIALRDPNLLIDLLTAFKMAKKLKDKPTIGNQDTQMLIALERFERLFKTHFI